MSGRPRIKVHVYDFDCKYIRTFDCINDFRKHYYQDDIGKRPLFQEQELGHNYQVIEEAELIALTSRPGREPIRLILAIHFSEYCAKQDQGINQAIQVFNMRGDLLAEFASQRLACKLMPHVSQAEISRQLNKQVKQGIKPKKVIKTGLVFKYKI